MLAPFKLPLLVLLCAALIPVPATGGEDSLTERLRYRLEALSGPGELVAAGNLIYAANGLQTLYDARAYRALWFDARNRPRPTLRALPEIIASVREEGLNPSDYHHAALTRVLTLIDESPPGQADSRVATDAELLATDALLTLARHLDDGKVDPRTIDPRWFLSRRELSDSTPILDAVDQDPEALRAGLQRLLPRHTGYATLRQRLALQRELATNPWPFFGEGPALRPGQEDPRVPVLRERLRLLGDLEGGVDDSAAALYDAELERAVRRFQARHGLEADAIVGAATRGELNVTPQQRIDQIRANMARWRWLPRELGDEHILVNIAGFSMDVVQGGERVMRQRVIVGRPYRQTPVFSGRMTYLVLNPSWEVPHSIATRDILPQIQADRGHLARMGFNLLQGWGSNERAIDPDTVNWSALSASRFPYRLRQAPGPQNALGVAKFMFPNPHAVYLHDTPSRGLFAREDRAFSSGCIRIADPVGLAEWLLGPQRGASVMSPEQIRRILAQSNETTVRLGRPIPVHLLYWTAWVEEDGRVHYRRDIYTRDRALIEALDAEPPRT